MRKRTAALTQGEKVRCICVCTDDIYGGMIARRSQEDSQLTKLAGSIARYGLLQPVVVRRNPASGRYALVCGARRLAACRLLGMKEINAMLIEADEDEALACFLQEHVLHAPPHFLMEAELIAGKDAADLLDDDTRIRQMLALHALEEPVKEVIRRYALSLEQAKPLLGIAKKDRRMEAAMIIAERSLSPAQARRLVCGPQIRDGYAAPTGRRRIMRLAMEEASRMAERLRALGFETGMTVHTQECGICVQMQIQKKSPVSRK